MRVLYLELNNKPMKDKLISMDYAEYYEEAGLRRANELKEAGKIDEAITECNRVISRNPSNSVAYELVGDCFLVQHEYEKAGKALKYGVKLSPDSANMNYLLGFLHSALRHWPSSVKYLSKSNDAFPNNAEILRCLGWSVFHKGEEENGIAMLCRARAMFVKDVGREDVWTLMDLAVTYMTSYRLKEAKPIVEEILKIEPDNEVAKSMLEAIKQFNS